MSGVFGRTVPGGAAKHGQAFRAAVVLAAAVAFAGPLLSAGFARAEGPVNRTIVIENHRFQPSSIEVPAGEVIRLIVENRDATPEEFESRDLPCEKVVAGKSKAIIRVGPLKKGSYSFVGEFHEDTARGTLVAN